MMRRACRAALIAIIGLAGRAHGFAAEPLPERTSYSGGMLGDENELIATEFQFELQFMSQPSQVDETKLLNEISTEVHSELQG